MTSRSVPGLPEPSGVPNRVPNRGQILPQHFQRQIKREDQSLADLTSDGDSRMHQETTSHKTRQFKAAPVGPDGKSLGIDSNAAARAPTRHTSRGKPQLYLDHGCQIGGVTMGAGLSAGANIKSMQSNAPQPLSSHIMPFPPRPGNQIIGDGSRSGREMEIDAGGAKSRKGLFDPPPAALCFPNSKPIDYYPWYGNHQEDTLTESLVKTGFSNKPPGQESQTGRPSLHGQLKAKHGLQNLSHVFIRVLEQRKTAGRLTAPSTFKPPPRVTMPESKREQWLRELANPTVPLRRLARTIPHSIQGEVLLEQCLAKEIPTARAVWFAKCVGVNAMRPLKKKGVTTAAGPVAEIQWIKEWTVSVERFVDGVNNSCGQPEWRKKIDYAIRLSWQLYVERLMDHDSYLDWLLASLESAPSEKLFTWVIQVQLLWREFVSTRRRGSRLAESLLQHLHSELTKTGGAPNMMTRRLDQLILTLLIAHHGCLLLPRTWKIHEETLQALLSRFPNGRKTRLSGTVQDLSKRNRRLQNGEPASSLSNFSPEKQIMHLLDSVGHKVDINQIVAYCTHHLADHKRLLGLILAWSCSNCRTGDHRIYLAIRFLGKLNSMGIETDTAVLDFLKAIDSSSGYDKRSFYRIVTGLVRMKRFSVGKYLQWLIATGSTSLDITLLERIPSYIELILEVPTDSLSEQTENLRQTILQGMNYSTEDEDERIYDLQVSMLEWIQGLATGTQPHLVQCPIFDEANKQAVRNFNVRSALSRELRHEILDRNTTADTPMSNTMEYSMSSQSGSISLLEFCCIREAIERLEDYTVLADVLQLVVPNSDYVLLAAVANTLDYRSLTFAAIGALIPLIGLLTKRYMMNRQERTPDKLFLRAYSSLCINVNLAQPLVFNAIKYDLARIEQQNSVIVCSPASDNMTEILQTTPMDTDDEIERILTSGNSMDRQIMGRVFKRIVSRLADRFKGNSDLFTSWFPRLRSFEEAHFDDLVLEWLVNLLVEQQTALLRVALPILVSSGCLGLEPFAKKCPKALSSLVMYSGASAAQMSTELLQLMLPSEEVSFDCHPQDGYRYRLEQRRFCLESTEEILNLTRQCIDLHAKYTHSGDGGSLAKVIGTPSLLNFLKPLVLSKKKLLLNVFAYSPEQSEIENLRCVKGIFDMLLDPTESLRLSTIPLSEQVGVIVDAIDDLSLPLCQIGLQFVFRLDKLVSEEGENGVEMALLDAIKLAVDRKSSGVSELVSGLGEGVTRKIREHTEEQILNAIPLPEKRSMQALHEVQAPDQAALDRYLAVVDSITTASEGCGNAPLILALLEKLKALNECLTDGSTTGFTMQDTVEDTSTKETIVKICPWLEALLHLTVAHRPAFQSSKGSTLMALLCMLRSFLVNPRLQKHQPLTQYIYDVAALFSDDLPDDLRLQFSKAEASRRSTDLTSFIFGGTPVCNTPLGLVISQGVSAGALSIPSPSLPGSSQSPNQQAPSRTTSPANQQNPMRSQTPQQRMVQQQQQQQQQQRQQLQQFQQQRLAQNQGHSFLQSFNQPNIHPTGWSPNQLSFSQQQQSQYMPMQGLQFQSQQQQQQHQLPTPSSHSASPANPLPPRPPSTAATATATGQTATPAQDVRPIPFMPRVWELLPDLTGNAGGNDTAISLQLFGARKVA